MTKPAAALPIFIPTPESIAQNARTYTPNMAILFHASEAARSYGGDARDYMLTVHPIKQSRAGAPHLGPGKVMGEDDGRELGNLLLQADDARTSAHTVPILPEQLLTLETDALTWMLPARRTLMHCLDNKGKRHALDVLWPNLVMRVVRRKLFVIAVESVKRPAHDSRIFAAPLANVHSDTSVCTGSAILPRSSGIEAMRGWESVIYNTYNTHTNHDRTLKGGASSDELLAFWQGRVGKRTPPSPRAFTRLPTTFGSWLKSTRGTHE